MALISTTRRNARLALATCAAAALAACGAGAPASAQTADPAADLGLRGATSIQAAPGASINYGKPRKLQRRPFANPTPKGGKPPLPLLEPYKTSYAARQRGRARLDPDRAAELPPTGVAMPATIPAKAPKKAEEKPFDPVGVDIGSLRLKPYLEALGGYDDNPNRMHDPTKGSAALRGEVGTSLESLWANHQLRGAMKFGYSAFPNVKGSNRPDGAAKIDGRIDVLRDTTLDVGAAASITTIRSGSPEIQPGSTSAVSTNQPVTWSVGGYLGATHNFNRLEASLRGTVEHSETGDATFSDGSTQRLSLNSFTTLGVRPRLAYEVSPAFKPFVEAVIDRRNYDAATDSNGYRRNSNGLALRGGASFELAREIKGEVAGGYVERDYEDPRLLKLRGPTVDAALIWTASPLTTVTLRGSTNVNETSIPNASGAISRKVTGEISHALLRNVTLTGMAGYQVTSYQGTNLNVTPTGATGINERMLTAGFKAEYSLTRTVVVKASYALERLKSTVQGSDYTANIFLLGLRLQR